MVALIELVSESRGHCIFTDDRSCYFDSSALANKLSIFIGPGFRSYVFLFIFIGELTEDKAMN